MVQLNKCPIYQTGAIAINPNRGQPKVGRLLQPVWSLSETCPFKVTWRMYFGVTILSKMACFNAGYATQI